MKAKLLFLLLCSSFFLFNSCEDEELSVDLTGSITASTLTPAVGSDITFTIVAKNIGPDNATGVDVTNNLPTGYTVKSATPSVGSLTDRAWVIGDLASGKSETLTVVATVLSTGTHSYLISVLGDQPDPSSLNNNAEAKVVPVQPYVDMTAALSASSLAPEIGGVVTFVVTIENDGMFDATSVEVANQVGPGYTITAVTPSTGTWNSPNWIVGNVAKGQSATLTIDAKVNESGSYAVSAEVKSKEADSNTLNNKATIATVPVPGASSKVTYDKDIKPLIVNSCTPCHVAGGYQKKFDQYANAKADISKIINRVSRAKGSSGFMPQGGEKLSDANIALLNQWVTDGLLEK